MNKFITATYKGERKKRHSWFNFWNKRKILDVCVWYPSQLIRLIKLKKSCFRDSLKLCKKKKSRLICTIVYALTVRHKINNYT